MTSPVTVANLALIRLSVAKITSFSDKKKAADVMSTIYANARDTVLRKYPFKFAKKRAILAPVSVSPKWGFEYAYELPTDSVRLLFVDGHYVGADMNGLPNIYRIEGRQILTNTPTSIRIIYISNAIPEAFFDPDFTRVFSLQLAIDGHPSLAGRGTSRSKIESEFVVALSEAKLNGSLEELDEDAYSPEWEDSRSV